MSEEFIRLSHVSKIYNAHQDNEVRANDDLNFNIKRGELTVIVGSSCAGKSTLLNTLGGMDSVSEGEVWVNGIDIAKFSEKKRTTYRRRDIGFVFQFYNLIPNLTALENVELANEIAKDPLDAKKAMKSVGLEKRMDNFPPQMSGGEQQRVAVARAIAKNPALLLADEPTGALDYHTGKKILKIFQDYVHDTGKNVVIVTHNSLIKPMADHVIEVVDGKIKSDVINDHKTPVEDLEW